MTDIASDFLTPILPVALELMGLVLGALLIRATSAAKDRWGIEIEARHREALHAALMSGARAALMRGLTDRDAITAAIDHARKSVPDAIGKLRPEQRVMVRIAEAKLRDALGLRGGER